MVNHPDDIDVYISLPTNVALEAERLHRAIADRLSQTDPIRGEFHITLYQGVIPQSRQAAFFHALERLLQQHSAFQLDLADCLIPSGDNLFWHCSNNPALQALHEAVMNLALSGYRAPGKIPHVTLHSVTTGQPSENVIQYGMRHAMASFKPHITVFYNIGDHTLISDMLETIHPAINTFQVDTIKIGMMGKYGQVLQALHTVNLSLLHLSS